MVANAGIWAGAPGSLVLAARAGSQAPGTPAGARFESFTSVIINGAGQVAIGAFLANGSGGVNDNNRSGIWAGSPSSLQLVARRLGDTVYLQMKCR